MTEVMPRKPHAAAVVVIRFGFDQPPKDFFANEIAVSFLNDRKLQAIRSKPIIMSGLDDIFDFCKTE
jgi:hypothetical protein